MDMKAQGSRSGKALGLASYSLVRAVLMLCWTMDIISYEGSRFEERQGIIKLW